MDTEILDHLRDIYAVRLSQTLNEACMKLNSSSTHSGGHPLKHSQAIMKKLSEIGRDSLKDEYEPIVVASALVMQAKLIMLESESTDKCEVFAEILKLEAENFEKGLPAFFNMIAPTDEK